MKFELVVPTLGQIETLYLHLNARAHNISNKNLPSFAEHKNFVENHPYRKWMIIRDSKCAIGNVYIQYDNSIGLTVDPSVDRDRILQILKDIYLSYSPLPAVASIRIGEFFLKVASGNEKLQAILVDLDFHEVERSFVPSKSDLDAWRR